MSITFKPFEGVGAQIFRSEHSNVVIKYLYTYYKRCWRFAIGEFVLAVASELHVDTGMSMASLFPVAAKVRKRKAVKQILSSTGRRGGGSGAAYDPDKIYDDGSGRPKSQPLGETLGRDAYQIKMGSETSYNFFFEYEIVIVQWERMEQYWNAIALGEAAFAEAIDRYWDRINTGKLLLDYIEEGGIPLDIEPAGLPPDDEVPF
jgi:hypothetical protein